jgi:hypothetical protein
VQAPDAFRLILAMELNRVRAPTVEASPIPKTLIATIVSIKVNAASDLRILSFRHGRYFGPRVCILADDVTDTVSFIFPSPTLWL